MALSRRGEDGLMSIDKLIAITSLVFVLLLFSSCSPVKECRYVSEETLIKSLRVDEKLSGSFFIGIGSVGSSPKYYYYKKSGSGYILESYFAEWITIVEDDSKEPAFVENYIQDSVFCKTPTDYLQRYLRVPKNTIVQEYTVN